MEKGCHKQLLCNINKMKKIMVGLELAAPRMGEKVKS